MPRKAKSDKAKHPGGRPPTLKDGKAVQVYLDASSLAIADKLGDGNVSQGIRVALRAASESARGTNVE